MVMRALGKALRKREARLRPAAPAPAMTTLSDAVAVCARAGDSVADASTPDAARARRNSRRSTIGLLVRTAVADENSGSHVISGATLQRAGVQANKPVSRTKAKQ